MKSDNGCSHQRGRHEGWRVLGGPRGWIRATGERDSNRRRCSAVAARRGAPATLILSLRVFVFVYIWMKLYLYVKILLHLYFWRNQHHSSALPLFLSFLYFSLIHICVYSFCLCFCISMSFLFYQQNRKYISFVLLFFTLGEMTCIHDWSQSCWTF